jgi:hypothetical protein
MTTFFLLVCSVSVVFFLVFLWQCGKPRRPVSTRDNAFLPSETITAYPTAGQRSLVHLESQMESFLASHQRSTSIL